MDKTMLLLGRTHRIHCKPLFVQAERTCRLVSQVRSSNFDLFTNFVGQWMIKGLSFWQYSVYEKTKYISIANLKCMPHCKHCLQEQGYSSKAVCMPWLQMSKFMIVLEIILKTCSIDHKINQKYKLSFSLAFGKQNTKKRRSQIDTNEIV